MKTILNEKYYDVLETAKLLGISATTIRNYFKVGKLSAKKIGKSWFVSESDVRLYLSEDKTTKPIPESDIETVSVEEALKRAFEFTMNNKA